MNVGYAAFRKAAHLAALLTRGPTCPWCLAHSWRNGRAHRPGPCRRTEPVMPRWYCDTCTPARVIGDRPCDQCCGWQPDPTNEDD